MKSAAIMTACRQHRNVWIKLILLQQRMLPVGNRTDCQSSVCSTAQLFEIIILRLIKKLYYYIIYVNIFVYVHINNFALCYGHLFALRFDDGECYC